MGLAAAAALAEAGAEVTLLARGEEAINRAAKSICEAGGKANAVSLDVTNLSAVSSFFKENPAFHIVINNAGTNRPLHMNDVTEEDFDAVMDLNVKGSFFVAQKAAQVMIAENIKGSIIHMGSQMGHVGAINRTLYCASKWAIEGLNKAMALDLAQYGIRSNVIAPTFIKTPLTKAFLDDKEFLDKVMDKIKLGRLGEVEDLMGAVVFLASGASALMTGSSLLIDGGWTAE
ncbi:SDR family oxidoreductase [bacterium AH-315-I11]|nr:SDR family oxidoreductase [bacterium AH-315-I11]